jgi:hypothetical protein
MVYENHRLKMVIPWKRWMAIEIPIDHSSPFRKQWSTLHQVPMGDGETSAKFEAWCTACLSEEVVILSLLKVVMNLLLELDLLNQSSCTIYLSVGGIYQ